MTTVINLLLLLLGFVGSLAAFGGETWTKGHEPILRRVTRRGWLSLSCLLAALALGTAKEVMSANEKTGLQNQVASLKTELRQQQALLAARRLDEIREHDGSLELSQRRLLAAQSAYDRFRNVELKVHGRARHKNAGKPYPINFSFSSRDFLFDVCSRAFSEAAHSAVRPEQCEAKELSKVLDLMPTQTYERNTLGPSAIAMLQYLGEISVAHRDALNRTFTLDKDNQPELSLADVLEITPKTCGVSQATADEIVDRAKVFRSLEQSTQQLSWLFTYGFGDPAPAPDARTKKYLHEQLEGSSAELLVQMEKLDRLNHPQAPRGDERVFSLAALTQNVSDGYLQLANDLGKVQGICKKRREELRAERERINTNIQPERAR